MQARMMTGLGLAAILLFAGAVRASITMDTVTVGNPGNAGKLSGYGAGGYGTDRTCGEVGYTYNIGKYEVTAGQYAAFLNAVGGVDAYSLYNTTMSRTDYGSGIARSGGGSVGNPYTYSVASDFVNRPVNYVSYWDACRFANWLSNGQPTGAQGSGTTERGAYTLDGYNGNGRRTVQRGAAAKWAVTGEDEWYKAAYYKGGSTHAGYWDYPTSSDTAPGRDMADASGNNANYFPGSGAWPIDSGKYTTIVGEFQNSDSPYGTFDQGGNVWEWNEAIVYQDQTCAYRGLRGGSFSNNGPILQASYRSAYYYYPTFEDYYVGFRVVQIPEPATLSLLALGGLALLRSPRRPSAG